MGKVGKEFGATRYGRRRALSGMSVGVLLLTLAACTSPSTRVRTPTTVPPPLADPATDRWPAQFRQAAPDVQDAYRFAIAHTEIQFIPCYCGCVSQGHASNRDCYIAKETPGGVILSAHAFDCGVCVSITHDVATLESQGVPLRQIRDQVDARWGLVGPGTKTSFPLDRSAADLPSATKPRVSA